MNTTTIAKLYDRLTPHERLPLILAASVRGDEAERQRLARSAPKVAWAIPNYFGASLGIAVVSFYFVMEQASHAVHYWHAVFRLDESTGAERKDWQLAAETATYLFCCNREAWCRFCEERRIDPDCLIDDLPGRDFLRYCEERMPTFVQSREALADLWEDSGRGKPELVTPADLLQGWRKTFQAIEENW